jgi:cell wall assembly regulator SMI1
LVAWLGVCNGPFVGPGGLFGVDAERDSLDIRHVMGRFPNWADLGWIPIAGDGSGNYFVLLPNPHKDVVAFVDATLDPYATGYVVASDLPRFLVALLKSEVEHDGQ